MKTAYLPITAAIVAETRRSILQKLSKKWHLLYTFFNTLSFFQILLLWMMDGRRHGSHENGILTQSNTFYVATKLNLNEFLWLIAVSISTKVRQAFRKLLRRKK